MSEKVLSGTHKGAATVHYLWETALSAHSLLDNCVYLQREARIRRTAQDCTRHHHYVCDTFGRIDKSMEAILIKTVDCYQQC